jgi:hypothetical protein
MAGARLVGREAAYSAAMASIEALERKFAQNIDNLVRDIDNHIKALTPVNTGQAVRNYIWTRNNPNSVVYSAIDNGPTGQTNQMALGTEPRRGVNEDAAASSLSSLGVVADPFGVIYLTNNSPDIVGLEMGILPGPPFKSRSPRGMFGVTEAYFNSVIATQGILK